MTPRAILSAASGPIFLWCCWRISPKRTTPQPRRRRLSKILTRDADTSSAPASGKRAHTKLTRKIKEFIMRSDKAKKGVERAPHRSLMKASGYTDWEIDRPWIGVVNSFNAIIPGHVHLKRITEAVKVGVYAAGGLPLEFPVIGVCDGIAMNHIGMKFSLPSREIVMDSIEIMTQGHALDALVMVTNCDKIIPGMAMAAAQLNVPPIGGRGGPMLAGLHNGKKIGLAPFSEAVGKHIAGIMP